MGRTPGWMPLGMGRDGEARTKRWLGVHTQTSLRTRSAPISPLTTRHHGNDFGGHALTVGMNTCIVCARSRRLPFFGGHIVVAGPMTSTKCHNTCRDCL